MRVHSLVTGIVIALLAVADAQLVSKPNDQEVISSDSHHDSRAIAGENNVPQRLLRRSENANNGDTEERTPNVDLLIQDFAHTLRKQTKWKAQFATWRYVNKMDPIAVGKHIGAIREDGILLVGSKNWPKFKAYRKFYGNGPLVYPKSIYSHTT